jgi:hypothetical protein
MVMSLSLSRVVHRRRALVEFALEVEFVLVEAGQQKLELFLEQFAVLLGVEQRRAEGLHLAGVVATPHPHDHPAVGDDIRHGVILRQPDRVPHRQHVEGAAELQPLGLCREPESELDQIRKDLVAFALKVMLGRPEHIVAEVVHRLRDVLHGHEHLAQPFVGIAPVVGRRAVQADVVELDGPT